MTTVEIDTLLPARPKAPSAATGRRPSTGCSRACSRRGSPRSRRSPTRRSCRPSPAAAPFFARTKENASLGALVKEDSIERGARDARQRGRARHALRLHRHGARAAEDQPSCATTSATWPSARTASRPAAPTSTSATSWQQETLPSAEDEYALHQRLLPTITLAEVNRLARDWFPDTQPRRHPDRAGQARARRCRTRRSWRRSSRDAEEKELTAYVDTAASATLLDAVPAAGTIARTSAKEAVGITEWELSNGVKVVLKPTTFKEDEILFTRDQPRRHVARERSGLHPGQHGDAARHRRRRRQAQRRSTTAR